MVSYINYLNYFYIKNNPKFILKISSKSLIGLFYLLFFEVLMIYLMRIIALSYGVKWDSFQINAADFQQIDLYVLLKLFFFVAYSLRMKSLALPFFLNAWPSIDLLVKLISVLISLLVLLIYRKLGLELTHVLFKHIFLLGVYVLLAELVFIRLRNDVQRVDG